jgi:multidrug resistance protein
MANKASRPLASCMIAPALSEVVAEFNIDNDFLASFVVSIYVLGLAFGPLLLGPFSEVYGRWICYTICNILYVVFNIASALSSNFPMLIVFRFLAGAMGSAPLTIGGGTIADLFPVHQRGMALSFYLLGPTSGPAIGPVAGGFLAQDKGWRGIFWSLAIVVRSPYIFNAGHHSCEHANGRWDRVVPSLSYR